MKPKKSAYRIEAVVEDDDSVLESASYRIDVPSFRKWLLDAIEENNFVKVKSIRVVLMKKEQKAPSPTKRKGKTVKHIVEEGSRQHVIRYDSDGRHCSEPDCEINKEGK